jgi:hypothetical protein
MVKLKTLPAAHEWQGDHAEVIKSSMLFHIYLKFLNFLLTLPVFKTSEPLLTTKPCDIYNRIDCSLKS